MKLNNDRLDALIIQGLVRIDRKNRATKIIEMRSDWKKLSQIEKDVFDNISVGTNWELMRLHYDKANKSEYFPRFTDMVSYVNSGEFTSPSLEYALIQVWNNKFSYEDKVNVYRKLDKLDEFSESIPMIEYEYRIWTVQLPYADGKIRLYWTISKDDLYNLYMKGMNPVGLDKVPLEDLKYINNSDKVEPRLNDEISPRHTFWLYDIPDDGTWGFDFMFETSMCYQKAFHVAAEDGCWMYEADAEYDEFKI